MANNCTSQAPVSMCRFSDLPVKCHQLVEAVNGMSVQHIFRRGTNIGEFIKEPG